MTPLHLALRSAAYYWRTNVVVMSGVALAVSVLAGALLVGDSVRGSLHDIAVGRLGRADYAVSSSGFFREGLAGDVAGADLRSAPLIVVRGAVTADKSQRRAGDVLVYGIDARFWTFHGLAAVQGTVLSPALASELGLSPGDDLLIRLQKPAAIPIESLFGRKEDIGRTLRLTAAAVEPRERLGEFALSPQQSEVRAVFAPLRRVQRDLGVAGRVNTVLLASGSGDAAVEAQVGAALQLEDLGISVSVSEDARAVIIESAAGILSPSIESAARAAVSAAGARVVPVFTYLANTLRRGNRQIPYSLITAIDVAALPASASSSQPSPPDPIVLNEWTARELGAGPGDRVEVDYYRWDAQEGLTTHTASFTVDRVIPIAGVAADVRLAPIYPGVTTAASLADWDPPFPIDLSRIRPADERYWGEYRTTPKAFIPFERGRDLWQSRYGAVTSIRVPVDPEAAAQTAARLDGDMRRSLGSQSAAIGVLPVRRLSIAASRGSTDFSEYFLYFSVLLVVSAILLVVVFFRLGIEQRLRDIGILRATGFSAGGVRRLFLVESIALAVAGSIIGMAGAALYAWLVVHGLRTWWAGAVGTTRLDIHLSWLSVVIGGAAGTIASVASVGLSLRTVARMSPRALLHARSLESRGPGAARQTRRAQLAGAILAASAASMIAAAFIIRGYETGLFFGSGAALLGACLCFLSASLGSTRRRAAVGRGAWALCRLGFRGAAFRRTRAVSSVALIASAVFVVVSVGAFRHGARPPQGDRASGTGAFALLARSGLPLVHDPNTTQGRQALGVGSSDLSRVRFTRFRERRGDDASCLNLYRPASPTIVAPEGRFIDEARFSFAASVAATEEEKRNPWILLRGANRADAIPVIADATSLEYVLHASVGDTLAFDAADGQPLRLQVVGALRDSVLQGELVMSEEHFVTRFPAVQGYRFFLIEAPDARGEADETAIAERVEQEFAPFGMDAVATADRLAAFHRVEDTYLSTFQALGGLGLVLGTFGLGALMFRNVLEQRRELAVLGAVGYRPRDISLVMLAEAALLVFAGLGTGTLCAAIAVAPAWLHRGAVRPGLDLALLLAGVACAGLLSSLIATRAALRGKLLTALREE